MKTFMKFTIAAAFTLGIISCSNDDGDEIKEINRVSIDSVLIKKDTMNVRDIQNIITYSKYQRNCEGFYGYNYEKDNFNRVVSNHKFKTDGACGETISAGTFFNFQPVETGTYTFKFWKGKDASDVDQFIEKTIVVE